MNLDGILPSNKPHLGLSLRNSGKHEDEFGRHPTVNQTSPSATSNNDEGSMRSVLDGTLPPTIPHLVLDFPIDLAPNSLSFFQCDQHSLLGNCKRNRMVVSMLS